MINIIGQLIFGACAVLLILLYPTSNLFLVFLSLIFLIELQVHDTNRRNEARQILKVLGQRRTRPRRTTKKE